MRNIIIRVTIGFSPWWNAFKHHTNASLNRPKFYSQLCLSQCTLGSYVQSRIITNKHANFFDQDCFFLLLLENSGLVTLLADVQMAKFDQNLTKIWSKFWSSPNFHLWLPNSDSPSKISFWDVVQRILVKVIVKYLQLFSNKNANFESLLLSSGKIGQGQFFFMHLFC